eukprot:GHVU01138981.1.p2 GENE.GHVU01138981.1~~GHVU01138981.1.p2  ORF type:complete len:109 (+),score=14.10 GHVU01138981.1:269-595(+)
MKGTAVRLRKHSKAGGTHEHMRCADSQAGKEASRQAGTCNVPYRTDDSSVTAGTDLRRVRVNSTRCVDVHGNPDLNVPGPEGEEEVEAEGEGEEVEMKWVCDFGSFDR